MDYYSTLEELAFTPLIDEAFDEEALDFNNYGLCTIHYDALKAAA